MCFSEMQFRISDLFHYASSTYISVRNIFHPFLTIFSNTFRCICPRNRLNSKALRTFSLLVTEAEADEDIMNATLFCPHISEKCDAFSLGESKSVFHMVLKFSISKLYLNYAVPF